MIDRAARARERHFSDHDGAGPETTNQGDFQMAESAGRVLTLTTQIAVAYMGANTVDARAVPELLRGIHRSLTGLEPDPAQGGRSKFGR